MVPITRRDHFVGSLLPPLLFSIHSQQSSWRNTVKTQIRQWTFLLTTFQGFSPKIKPHCFNGLCQATGDLHFLSSQALLLGTPVLSSSQCPWILCLCSCLRTFAPTAASVWMLSPDVPTAYSLSSFAIPQFFSEDRLHWPSYYSAFLSTFSPFPFFSTYHYHDIK
jgi:hypothetical protein